MTEPKKIAIMQPYFLPYIGYWQLINQVDEFVIYDTIQYTKKGWINRNRFLQNESDATFTLPLKKDSDFLNVCDRELSDNFDREKLIRQLGGAYKKAPFFNENFPIIESIIMFENNNLFEYINNSVYEICSFLNITTPIVKSSDIHLEFENEKGQDKVINIARARGGTDYINPIGGLDLYDKSTFENHGLNLHFMKADILDYTTFNGANALPHMSIVDVMMFNPKEDIISYLDAFQWVEAQ